ncbi:MAG: divergent PAP2 family protein [Candidatus Avilachnospira sp.]|jgi:acid phosphatase family membrane protein YuiD
MTVFEELLNNRILICAVVAWAIAQFLKTIIDFRVYKTFHPDRLVGSGGMPSSHSAFVCALATTALMEYGLSSFQFSISFALAAIVMYDATGVRRETGKQAKILNRILHENLFEWKGQVLEEKLKEYVGHTPLQVFAGAVLGIVIALLANAFF